MKEGSIHHILLTASIILLLSSIGKSTLSVLRSGRKHETIIYTPSILYGIALQISIGVSFALSTVSSLGQTTSYAESTLVGYVFCLQMFNLIYCCHSRMSFRRVISAHVIVLLGLLTALSFLGDIMPILLLHLDLSPEPIRLGTTASCLIGVIVLMLSPRTAVKTTFPTNAATSDIHEEIASAQRRKSATPSPEEYCSPFSYCMSYGWLDGLIFRGCKHNLSLEDLPPLPQYDEPLIWLSNILHARRRGLTQFKTVLLLMHRELLFQALFAMTTAILEFIAPFAMNRLLFYLQSRDESVIRPIFWVALLFLGPIARSVSYQQYVFTSTRLIVRVTNAMIQEIYHKAMGSILFDEISSKPKRERDDHRGDEVACTPRTNPEITPAFSVGHIMNLMSFDVDAIESARDIVLISVAVPIEMAIAITFLYILIGWSSIVGLAAMIVTVSLPAYFSHRMVNIQQGVMKYADQRISKISEYVTSIRVIKYFGWEEAVSNIIQEMRRLEQRQIWRRNLYAVAVVWSGDFIPLFSLFVMFTTYVLGTGSPLRADTAFTCLAIVETLRQQFIWVSNVSGFASQAVVSLRRLDAFFQGMVPVTKVTAGDPSFQRATFVRSPCSTFYLQDLHFDFLPGCLNVVTGPTGSGKTTLLLSLLGETVKVSGSVKCASNTAYVSQTPWLQSGTVRDSIVFHSSFDQARYDATIQACALLRDFDELPHGDLTEIAEQGSSLSGGQRQRVALARAIYSSASTLLLDDIFSALDVHTANHIFHELFRKDFLGQRTVILVSHLPPVLEAASLLVRLEHGRAVSVDVQNPVFTTMIETAIITQEGLNDRRDESRKDPAMEYPTGPSKDQARLEHMLQGRVPRTLCKFVILLM